MQFNPSLVTAPTAREFPPSWKKKGDSIEILQGKEKETVTIREVQSAIDKAKIAGINLTRDFPIYYIEERNTTKDAMYLLNKDEEYIIMYPVATDFELRHELIHACLSDKDPTPELLEFYEKVKQTISESSFSETDRMWFNFTKSLDEFIVDGYNHSSFISALKKESLYDEFLEVTKYLRILN